MRELIPRQAISSLHNGWELLKAAAAQESDLADDAKDAVSFIAAGAKKLLNDINLAEIAVAVGAEVTAATVVIYAARYGGGPAEKVASIACVPGAQVVGVDPVSDAASTDLWVDEMTVTGSWFDDVKTADAGGNDGVARAMFDLYGRAYLFAVVTGITGTGGVRVFFSGV